jgi:hypothetical protein
MGRFKTGLCPVLYLVIIVDDCHWLLVSEYQGDQIFREKIATYVPSQNNPKCFQTYILNFYDL